MGVRGQLGHFAAFGTSPEKGLLTFGHVQIVRQGNDIVWAAMVSNSGGSDLYLGGADIQEVYPFQSRASDTPRGAWRVGLEVAGGNGSGIDHPWRWGLNTVLVPGQSQFISGRVTDAPPGEYWLGIVEEQIAWHEDGLAKFTDAPAAPVQAIGPSAEIGGVVSTVLPAPDATVADAGALTFDTGAAGDPFISHLTDPDTSGGSGAGAGLETLANQANEQAAGTSIFGALALGGLALFLFGGKRTRRARR